MKLICYQHFGDINNFGKIILEPYLTYLYYVFYHSCFIFFRTSRETNKKVSKLILHTIICGILLCYVKRLCVYENENFFQEFDQSTKRLHVYAGISFCPSRQASLIVCAPDCIS